VVAVIATLIGDRLPELAAGQRIAHERGRGVHRRALLRLAWGGWGLLLGLPILAVLKSISDRVESMRPGERALGLTMPHASVDCAYAQEKTAVTTVYDIPRCRRAARNSLIPVRDVRHERCV
jgi:hypothetical protein